jgi:hypothetical protein
MLHPKRQQKYRLRISAKRRKYGHVGRQPTAKPCFAQLNLAVAKLNLLRKLNAPLRGK